MGMSHISSKSSDLIARVRRISGQVGAIERAIQSDAGCAEILHLVAAVRGAVNGLLDEVIAEHLEAHVSRAGLGDEERAQGADELLAVIRRYSK
jgi:DNA-binding FrmR family transcriptional regulator